MGRNRCLYAWWRTAPSLRIYERSRWWPTGGAQPSQADIPPRQKAMCDFALKINEASYQSTDPDFGRWLPRLSREDVWDIAAIAAFFGLSTAWPTHRHAPQRLSSTSWGRVPRAKKEELP